MESKRTLFRRISWRCVRIVMERAWRGHLGLLIAA